MLCLNYRLFNAHKCSCILHVIHGKIVCLFIVHYFFVDCKLNKTNKNIYKIKVQ